MVQDENFHFVGRSHTTQVSINVQASKHSVLLSSNEEKLVNCSGYFFNTCECHAVPGTILGTGDVIVDNYMKSPVYMSHILQKRGRVTTHRFLACL